MAIDINKGLVSACRKAGRHGLKDLTDAGIKSDMISAEAATALDFIRAHVREHNVMPSEDYLSSQTGIRLPQVEDPLSVYIKEVRALFEWNMHAAFANEHAALINKGTSSLQEARSRHEQFTRDIREAGTTATKIHSMWGTGPDVLKEYEDAKAGIMGIPTPWPSMDKITRGWGPSEFVVFGARTGVGKCVSASSKVTCADSGRLVTMKELVENKLSTLTHDRERGVVGVRPKAWVKSGRKRCLKVKSRLGNEVVVPPNDQILTGDGWKRAENIVVGDMIAQAAKVPEPLHPVSLGEAEITLLAVLLSEGSMTGGQMAFSSGDPAFIEAAKEAADTLGFRVSYRSKYDYGLARKNGTGITPRGWMIALGVPLVKAVEKRIPDFIFMLPNDELALFMKIFWWGDGCKDRTITLGSEGMIDDLKHLFLRFGVVMKKEYRRVKYKEGRDAWRLRPDAWTYPSMHSLMSGIPGDKGRSFAPTGKSKNTNVNVIPISDEMVSRIREAGKDYRINTGGNGGDRGLFSDAARSIGWKSARNASIRSFVKSNSSGKYSRLGRQRFRALVDTASPRLDDFGWMDHEDLVWSPVVSVEDDGLHDVYDLSIPGTECYIADGVVVHNTYLLLMCAIAAWNAGHHVLFISPEMTKESLASRVFSLHLGIGHGRIRDGALGDQGEEVFYKGVKAMQEEDGFDVLDSGFRCSVSSIEDSVSVIKPDIVFGDGIYLFRGEGRTRTDRMAYVADELKAQAGMFRIPYVCTTQFNRQVDKNEPHTADISKLGLSDVIGQNASVAFALIQTDEMRAVMEWMLRPMKLRHGGSMDDIWTRANFETMDFSEQGDIVKNVSDEDVARYANKATLEANELLDKHEKEGPFGLPSIPDFV
jgi:intein/homing endonuclease